MRPDDGVCLDCFQVEQRLRQRCVLSPLLVHIFFTAVLTTVLHIFSEDTVILAELVRMKEPLMSMGSEPARTMFVVRCGACSTRMAPV